MNEDEERTALLKAMSFAIGSCGSVKPEVKAMVALAALEEMYDVVRRIENE